MPRECLSRHDTAPLHYDNDAYLDDNADSYPRSQSDTSSSPPSPVQPLNPKKKHYCTVCGRSFTTSGHLARHSRVHTGERNHICPFPGCQTRCSRQDNLQQHYRIHLSPGSRRGSSASARAALKKMANQTTETSSDERQPKSRSTFRRTNPFPALSAPPASLPPSTFGAEIYDGSRPPSVSPPPDSPPPLVPARPSPHILTSSYSASSCSSASPSPQSDPASQNVHPVILDPSPVLIHNPQDPSSRLYSVSKSGVMSYEEQAKVAPAPDASYVQPSRYQYSSSNAYASASSPVSPVHQREAHPSYQVESLASHHVSPVDPSPHVSTYHARAYESYQNAHRPQPQIPPSDHQHQRSPSDVYAQYPSQSTSRHPISNISQPRPQALPYGQHSRSGYPHSSSPTSVPHSISPLESERATPVHQQIRTGEHISTHALSRQPTLESASFSANEGSFASVYNVQGEPNHPAVLSNSGYSYTYRRDVDHHVPAYSQQRSQYLPPQSQPATAPPSRYPSPRRGLPPMDVPRVVDGAAQVYTQLPPHQPSNAQHVVEPAVHGYAHYQQTYDSSQSTGYLHQPQPVMPGTHYQTVVAPVTGHDWREPGVYDARGRHPVV